MTYEQSQGSQLRILSVVSIKPKPVFLSDSCDAISRLNMGLTIPENPRFGTILGMGGSCFVFYVDNSTVHKSYEIWVNDQKQSVYPEKCEDDLAREDAIYNHLGEHDCILRSFGLDKVNHDPLVHALRLERAPLGTVRDLVQDRPGDPLPEPIRLRMCRDVAAGIAYIHSRHVWHSDNSCRNLLVFDGYRIKICDFGGSIIQGRESSFPDTVAEEPQYELPCRGRHLEELPRLKRELFALGSCIYEIMAWTRPFQGLQQNEVSGRYENDIFPALDGFPALVARAVKNCWGEAYDCTDDVVELLEELSP